MCTQVSTHSAFLTAPQKHDLHTTFCFLTYSEFNIRFDVSGLKGRTLCSYKYDKKKNNKTISFSPVVSVCFAVLYILSLSVEE